MGTISMQPDAVASWGRHAHRIGADVHAAHRHVADAGTHGASAGMAGFATFGALTSFADTGADEITGLGRAVEGTGDGLVGSANAVASADDHSAGRIDASGAAVLGIETRIAVPS